jgi:hypothetical protein
MPVMAAGPNLCELEQLQRHQPGAVPQLPGHCLAPQASGNAYRNAVDRVTGAQDGCLAETAASAPAPKKNVEEAFVA